LAVAFVNIFKKITRVLTLLAVICHFSSCGVKKYLNDSQALLVKNKVEIEEPYRKETATNIVKYYRQKPNNRFMLIINSRPYFYIRGSQGKDNWWKKFERTTLGEPPVLVDSVFIHSTLRSFASYLNTEGYYYPEIGYTLAVNRRKKATVTYHVKLNKQYVFGEYHLQVSDKEIFMLVEKNMKETLIKTGRGFHHDNLKKEQERIIDLLRNNGYYGISTESIDFDIDTTSPDGFVQVGLNIRNATDSTLHKRFYVEGISVDIERNLGSLNTNTDTFTANGITYNLGGYKLNPNVLRRNIQFETGELYSQQKLNRTYSRVTDLGVFRFINIQTKLRESNDSGYVLYNVRLIPAVKYSFTFEPQAITSDQNNTVNNQSSRNYGIAFLTQVTNRNVFRNAEILQLSFRSSFEAQGSVEPGRLINATEQSLTASIIMPRTLWFPRFDKNLNFQSTRTIISSSAIYEVNTTYKRTVFTTGLGYQFNKKLFTYFFNPLEVSFVRSYIIDDELRKQSETDIFLQNTFSNNLILDTRYGLIFTNKSIAQGLSYVTIRWDAIELAGNMLTAINNLTGKQKEEDGSYSLFGVKYAQYAKTAVDFRYNTNYDLNNASVFRLFTGLAIPYGNTPQYVPFDRRYFTGGVNSLRAWKPRAVGPGTFSEPEQLDFSGEVKIEVNSEYRFNIYHKWFEGALFTDAGNVWAMRVDPSRPGSHFEIGNVLRSLAWDMGVGVRLNFEIVIIRFDFAIPIRDPSEAQSERWVIKGMTTSPSWIPKNTQVNFGIGYPF
jgi:outer membrane protein assembly factor BamA